MTKDNVDTKVNVKSGFRSGTGRRKTAVARVFLYLEKGEFTVNGVDVEEYFPSEQASLEWQKPFHIVGISHPGSKFSATVKIVGSGKSAQLGALVHGISRALAQIDPEYSLLLHKNGLLTRDSRMVERKKYWLRKARKSPQYSKR
ncbi:MAG: 30S ribosomal protein S9 [Patescibacteria group bacterium]|uniref:Small ribosomal subunit protein uS9 n=1 Tax=candidate division WWE3 bacterium TaxID=2053526 RepID=A0A955EB25_UNCKA|nr:30S ribosomal protein S9 [candidate division WWE3 bacterium]